MLKKLVEFFLPRREFSPELLRRYKLVISIMLLTVLFDLNYSGITVMIGMKDGTWVMLATSLLHLIIPFLVRYGVSLLVTINIYLYFGAQAVVLCIVFSGGFHSPVLPWLATTPIVAMLMGGRPSGIVWATINVLVVALFAEMDKRGLSLPSTYNTDWQNFFYANCFVGLVLIIFFIALVFENGKNAALKKLEENNELLAEERKRTALFKISQNIHDGVGQTLSLAKLTLHTIELDDGTNSRFAPTLALISKAIHDLRSISRDINDANIVGFDLREMIIQDVEQLNNTGRFKVMFEFKGQHRKMSPEMEFEYYRILQELVNNTLRHSNAQLINICFSYSDHGLSLVYSDNGIGISSAGISEGLGIRNMRSRVKEMRGKIEIGLRKGGGTEVAIEVPFKTIQSAV